MAHSRHELLFHPVRFRIIRALNGEQRTTQGIADALGDTPLSSIYRHLKLLLDANMVTIADTREINGITEKIYAMHERHHLSAEEFAALSKEQHIDNIELFAMSIMQSASKAITESPTENFDAMPLSYREYSFYATEEDFLNIRRAIFKILRDAEKQHDSRGNTRQKYKVNIATYEEPDF